MGTNEGLDRFKTCPSSFFISAEKLIEITILEFMQQLYNEIGSYLDRKWLLSAFSPPTLRNCNANPYFDALVDRIDTPPLDIPSNKQKSLEVDTDYLGASQNQTSLYLQAAPESAISVHRYLNRIFFFFFFGGVEWCSKTILFSAKVHRFLHRHILNHDWVVVTRELPNELSHLRLACVSGVKIALGRVPSVVHTISLWLVLATSVKRQSKRTRVRDILAFHIQTSNTWRSRHPIWRVDARVYIDGTMKLMKIQLRDSSLPWPRRWMRYNKNFGIPAHQHSYQKLAPTIAMRIQTTLQKVWMRTFVNH